MPKVETLVEDIYAFFDKEVTVSPEDASVFGEDLARIVIEQVSEQRKPHLRLSNLGKPCTRQLWYDINTPELAERMPGHVRIKFLIGHITESVILFLTKLAGHSVTDEQRTVELHGVKGHIDGLVDGELVDIKSASPYSFNKFRDGLKAEGDAFGYLDQLGSYGSGLGLNRGHFLVADKVLGKLHLDTHDFPEVDYAEKVNQVRSILDSPEPPPRGYEDEADGASGNRKLGVACSYCSFKQHCWPGVQTYAYANGPRFLTKVVREPKVDKA